MSSQFSPVVCWGRLGPSSWLSASRCRRRSGVAAGQNCPASAWVVLRSLPWVLLRLRRWVSRRPVAGGQPVWNTSIVGCLRLPVGLVWQGDHRSPRGESTGSPSSVYPSVVDVDWVPWLLLPAGYSLWGSSGYASLGNLRDPWWNRVGRAVGDSLRVDQVRWW